MAVLTAKQIVNLYLYGSETTPQNKVDGELIRIKNPFRSTEIRTSTRDFMATAGRFAIGSQFDSINKFFSDSFINISGETYYFDKKSLAEFFNLQIYSWTMQQKDWRDGNDDYAERTYIWKGASQLCNEYKYAE